MPPSSEQEERRLGRGPGPLDSAAPAEGIRFTLAVDWVSPSLARERVRRWLTEYRWSPELIQDLVLVINEAVSNSIEHGYGVKPEFRVVQPAVTRPAFVEVDCRIVESGPDGARRARLAIRDGGVWRPPTPSATRGRGIALMLACTERLDFTLDDTGTTVIALSPPHTVPPFDL